VARRTAIAAVAVALALVASTACSKGGADRGSAGAGPTNTVATEPPQTTTTNPYAVPAVIDAAYVNRVLAALDATVGDVTRLVMQTKTIPREAYDRLRAFYGTDSELQGAIDNIQGAMLRNFSGYKPQPGNKLTTVTQLVTATNKCVFVRVSRDYSAVGVNALTADTQWIGMRPLDIARDPNRYNPTMWAVVYEGFPPDHTQPANPCAS